MNIPYVTADSLLNDLDWKHERAYSVYRDTVIIWDEDYDRRVFACITELPHTPLLIGERKGEVVAIFPVSVVPDMTKALQVVDDMNGGGYNPLSGRVQIPHDYHSGDVWNVEGRATLLWRDDIVSLLDEAEYKNIHVERPLTYKMWYFLWKRGLAPEVLAGMPFNEACRIIGEIKRGVRR